MKSISILYILVFLSTGAYATDNYPKNLDIDVQHYAFSIGLSDDSDEIHGMARIFFTSKKDGINKIRLDLISQSETLLGKGMKVESISENGKEVRFTHEHDILWITLDSYTKANASTILEIRYHGVPATGLIIGPNKYNDRTFFSDNWPNKARNWLPTVDHPYDKATCEFIVTAPVRYQVISNGLKVEESILDNGLKLTHWKQSAPIASWLFVLGVAEFAVQYVDNFEGKSIQTWVYRQDRDAGFYDFAVPTKEVMSFYTDYIGPYAYEKLANVQTNSVVSGGMESATAIFYSDGSVTGERTERWRNVIIHEIAHQWFGNAVTEYDWDDVWLSEGFATYFTLLFIENAYGQDEFVKGLKLAREKVFTFYKNNPDYRIVHDNLDDMSKVTTIQTYQKGAWVLHMLRMTVGEEAFENGIKTYYKKYMNLHASTTDFIKEIELASGKDLTLFFKQWLYQGGNVEIKGRWQYNSKGKTILIEMDQVQKKYVFTFPVEIAIYEKGSAKPRIETITLDKVSGKFEFSNDTMPDRIELDPNSKLLATWNFGKK